MNLFVVGWGLGAQRIAASLAELHRTAALYPLLDSASLWSFEAGSGVVAASVRTPDAVAAPRVYLHQDADGAAFFDGLPIDPTGSVTGHRADRLDASWDRLPSILEGRYCAVRLRRQPVSIELLTDSLGIEQVFVHEAGGTGLISNSAGLIERVIGSKGLDPLGTSTFLALDYVGADRTLRPAIRTVPAAQHWTWAGAGGGWTRRTYWSLAEQALAPDRAVDAGLIAEVTSDLTRFSAAAAEIDGQVNAPLTGGRDSRMLAAVLVAGRVPTRFWTKGDTGSQDVAVGRAIAARYGLPHWVANRPTQAEGQLEPTDAIAVGWDALSTEFVTQTDGMASLINIGNILGQPRRVNRLAVSLAGLSGESARAADGPSYLSEPGSTAGRIKAILPMVLMPAPRGLVRKEAYRLATEHMGRLIDDAAQVGVPVNQLSNVFYIGDRCRRWASLNPRELAQTEDKVLPFLTRAFVSAALAIGADDRWVGALHRGVMRTAVPGMDHDPPFDRPWPERVPWSTSRDRLRAKIGPRVPHEVRIALIRMRESVRRPATGRAATTPYDEPQWIEANLDSIREVCLSDPASELWKFANRRVLEHLLDARTSPAERRLSQLPLFATITICTYEGIARRLADEAPSAAADGPWA